MDSATNKDYILQEYFKNINIVNIELFNRLESKAERLKGILPLIEFTIDRLAIVTDLASKCLVWDADIIYRSAIETLAKTIFILSSSKEEQAARIHEYWFDLAEINRLKQSEQAKKNLSAFGHIEQLRIAYAPSLLSDLQEIELRKKWSKKARAQLEQKWSFSEIILSLSENYRGVKSPEFVSFLHFYRIASHILHGDETGIGIIAERQSRPPDNQENVTFAHSLRLLNDTLTFCAFIGFETMKYLNEDVSFFLSVFDSITRLSELGSAYHDKVFEDPMYDQYKQQNI